MWKYGFHLPVLVSAFQPAKLDLNRTRSVIVNVTSPADVIFHLLDSWTGRVPVCRLHIGLELAVRSFIIFYRSIFRDLITVGDDALKIQSHDQMPRQTALVGFQTAVLNPNLMMSYLVSLYCSYRMSTRYIQISRLAG